MAFPPTFDRAWDETFPPDTQLANLLGQDIRNFKTDIRERLSLLSGTLANRPSNMDAIYGGAGFGILYFATDTSQIFQWNGAAWVDVSALILGIPSGGAAGSPRIIFTLNSIAQSVAVLNANFYTVPAGQSGLYRISSELIVTQVGTGGTLQFYYNWNNGLAAPSIVTSPTISATALGAGTNIYTGAAGPDTPLGGIFVPAGQSITYSIQFNGVTGALQYAFRARLEYLG